MRPGTDAEARTRPLASAASLPVLVCAVYLLLACLAFWPTGPLDGTHLPSGALGDPDEAVWFLAWTPWAILHGHNPLLTHALDVPTGVNLADNAAMPLLGLLLSPFGAGFGAIAAYNLGLRLALGTSAIAGYLVFRRWCRGELGPALGGAAFGFGPALVSHLAGYGHLNLVAVGLLPLLLATLDELLVRRRWPAWRSGAALGVLAAAQYLVSAELFADAAVLGVLGGVALGVSSRPSRADVAHVASGLAVAIVVFAAIAGYPLAVALDGPGHLLGPVQARAHLQRFRVDVLEPVLPAGSQWLDPGLLRAASARALAPIRAAGGAAETGGYLSLPLLACAALGALVARRPVARFGALMALVAFVLSLGSRLQVAGHTLGVPLPEALLSRLGPLESTVPARYAVFTLLFVALLAAVGVDGSLASLGERRSSGAAGGRRRVAALATLALGTVGLVAIAPSIPVSDEQPATSSSTLEAVRALVPAGSTVLAYPYPEPPFAEAMLWQAADHFAFSVVGGYANVRGPGRTSSIAPPLSAPPYVQERLAASEAGPRPSHYPRPSPVSDPSALLCRFLVAHGANAVLYAPFGPGSNAVLAWFDATLGPPSASRDGLAFWRVTTGSCGSPAGS